MMKILNNKAGITVLEGIIALGLLAVVTAGAFGVLVSASRKSSQPDMREEMALTIENTKNLLRMYSTSEEFSVADSYLDSRFDHGLCENEFGALLTGEKSIKCMLPQICDKGNDKSNFTYTVGSLQDVNHHLANADIETTPQVRMVTFNMACNGYEL